jgi:hypothetical protein
MRANQSGIPPQAEILLRTCSDVLEAAAENGQRADRIRLPARPLDASQFVEQNFESLPSGSDAPARSSKEKILPRERRGGRTRKNTQVEIKRILMAARASGERLRTIQLERDRIIFDFVSQTEDQDLDRELAEFKAGHDDG